MKGWNHKDTIAAIATPHGSGGIGVIRISGQQALEHASAVFCTAKGRALQHSPSHQMRYGWVKTSDGLMDEALAVAMRAPRSYTGEDVAELHCHGGKQAQRTVLAAVLNQGARLANPGEFTWRAFMHGRLDLTQVEAVADIIEADSALALRGSVEQLRGGLQQRIAALQQRLQHLGAYLAACIDFSDEGDVQQHTQRDAQTPLHTQLQGIQADLLALLDNAEKGRRIREGLTIALIGPPNAGKSSLLNALLQEERAIVSAMPGTTRDTIEEAVEWEGLAVRLVDTAGLRNTSDAVEQQGVLRSKRAWKQADFGLVVLDGTQPLSQEGLDILQKTNPKQSLVLIAKQDAMSTDTPSWHQRLQKYRWLRVSSKKNMGLNALKQKVLDWCFEGSRPQTEEALLTNMRQINAAQRAMVAVERALQISVQHGHEELLAVEVDCALTALGDIVGHTTTEDVLGLVFSRFCIGK